MPCPASRELERAFVGLGSGVTEENLRGEGAVGQLRRQQLARQCPIKIRGVNQAGAQRVVDRLRDSGVSVPERVHSNTAGEIEIPLAIGVDELDALTAHQLHGSALVGTEKRIRI